LTNSLVIKEHGRNLSSDKETIESRRIENEAREEPGWEERRKKGESAEQARGSGATRFYAAFVIQPVNRLNNCVPYTCAGIIVFA
jgi:hypothetical protein